VPSHRAAHPAIERRELNVPAIAKESSRSGIRSANGVELRHDNTVSTIVRIVATLVVFIVLAVSFEIVRAKLRAVWARTRGRSR
jgi:hypothetical protein